MCKPGEGLCGRDVVFNEALLWTWRHNLRGRGAWWQGIIIIIIIIIISSSSSSSSSTSSSSSSSRSNINCRGPSSSYG